MSIESKAGGPSFEEWKRQKEEEDRKRKSARRRRAKGSANSKITDVIARTQARVMRDSKSKPASR